MDESRFDTLDDLLNQFREDPEYRRAERRLRPFTDISARMNTRRHFLGLSQTELANRANTHQSRISKIESGSYDVRVSTLVEIAEALGCEVRIDFAPVDEMDKEAEEYFSIPISPVRISDRNLQVHISTEGIQ